MQPGKTSKWLNFSVGSTFTSLPMSFETFQRSLLSNIDGLVSCSSPQIQLICCVVCNTYAWKFYKSIHLKISTQMKIRLMFSALVLCVLVSCPQLFVEYSYMRHFSSTACAWNIYQFDQYSCNTSFVMNNYKQFMMYDLGTSPSCQPYVIIHLYNPFV